MSETKNEDSPWYKSPFFWAFVAGALFLTAIRPFLRHIPKPPPSYGKLPQFTLVNQENKPFGTKQMKGKVTLVDFFFTRCPSICLQLTQSMKSLQKKIQDSRLPIKLLSISVDSDFDNPRVLTTYANKHEAKWTFATGTKKQIRELANKGFKVVVGKKKKSSSVTGMDIAHSQKIILIDQKGHIRGYYDSNKIGLDKALHQAVHVLREKK